MISIVDKLRDLVNDEILYKNDKGKIITLEEKQESKCKAFTIEKGSSNTLTLEVDLNSLDIHPLLKNGVKNLKKSPDYLIFCENKKLGKKTFVFSVELKSDNSDHWHRQAKAGLAIADYLIGMLENKEKRNLNITSSIEHRCVLFHTKNETSKIRKKKKTKQLKTEYDIHPIYGYKYTDRPCNVNHYLENLIV
jgi:hypothetical protein